MDINKLAVLTNQLGGYDEVENIINVPADLIAKAVAGDRLSNFEIAEIDAGFTRLYRDKELAEDYGLDLEWLFGIDEFDKGITGDLDLALHAISDVQDEKIFRQQFANGYIDVDDLSDAYGLFNNLEAGYNQRGRIIEYLTADAEYFEQQKLKTLAKRAERQLELYSEINNAKTQKQREFWEKKLSGSRKYYNRKEKRIDKQQVEKQNEVKIGLQEMLEAYDLDGGNIWKDNGAFWQWFRETFYGEE